MKYLVIIAGALLLATFGLFANVPPVVGTLALDGGRHPLAYEIQFDNRSFLPQFRGTGGRIKLLVHYPTGFIDPIELTFRDVVLNWTASGISMRVYFFHAVDPSRNTSTVVRVGFPLGGEPMEFAECITYRGIDVPGDPRWKLTHSPPASPPTAPVVTYTPAPEPERRSYALEQANLRRWGEEAAARGDSYEAGRCAKAIEASQRAQEAAAAAENARQWADYQRHIRGG